MIRSIRNLGVRAKLALVLGTVLLAFAGEIALSASAISQVRIGSEMYSQIQAYRDGIERATTLRSDLNEFQAVVLSFALETDRDLLAQADARRRQIGERVQVEFDEAIALARDEEIRVGLESARTTWREFIEATDAQVLPAVRRGDGETVRALLSGVQQRRYVRFIEQVGTAVNTFRLKVQDLEERARAVAETRTRVMVAGAAGVLLVTLAFAFAVARSITTPLGILSTTANRLAAGRIPARGVELESEDELGQLGAVFDGMMGALRAILARAQDAARHLDGSAKELLTANLQMSQGAKEQAAQLAAASGETARMAAALTELATTFEALSRTASENATAAEEGGRALSASTQGLDAIRAASTDVEKTLAGALLASDRIGAIVEAIQDIAAETHVLSLNASIEASRAGEAGRGFSVVASEVRALAERAAKSAREIRDIVDGIGRQMRAAQQAVSRNVTAVEDGIESGKILSRSFEGIHQSARQTHAAVSDMTNVVRDQVQSTQRTAALVGDVSRVAEDSLAATEQILAQGNRLHEVVSDLEQILGRFEVEDPPAPSEPTHPDEAPAAPEAAAA